MKKVVIISLVLAAGVAHFIWSIPNNEIKSLVIRALNDDPRLYSELGRINRAIYVGQSATASIETDDGMVTKSACKTIRFYALGDHDSAFLSINLRSAGGFDNWSVDSIVSGYFSSNPARCR